MYITLETDYAIRIVVELASGMRRIGAGKLSESTGVSLRFALKILCKLVGAGLVRSFKGTKGGYEIARSPSEISLYDVLCAIDGEYQFSRCLGGDFDCSHGQRGVCRAKEVFAEVTREVERRLRAVTFDQLI